MKTHRISTIISQKHWTTLKKYADMYKSQRNVLERALESLEKSPESNRLITPEDEAWARVGREIKNTLTIFQKEQARILFETADLEQFQKYIISQKPAEFAIEYYHKKPLEKCSLQEVVDAMILNIKFQGSADSINYADNGDHYTINITHNLGINSSKICVMMNESLFKSYGIKAESHFSERSIFYKIYKDPKTG